MVHHCTSFQPNKKAFTPPQAKVKASQSESSLIISIRERMKDSPSAVLSMRAKGNVFWLPASNLLPGLPALRSIRGSGNSGFATSAHQAPSDHLSLSRTFGTSDGVISGYSGATASDSHGLPFSSRALPFTKNKQQTIYSAHKSPSTCFFLFSFSRPTPTGSKNRAQGNRPGTGAIFLLLLADNDSRKIHGARVLPEEHDKRLLVVAEAKLECESLPLG